MRTTVAATLAFAAFSAALVSAQPQGLRTKDGHPDLQGTYDIASMVSRMLIGILPSPSDERAISAGECDAPKLDVSDSAS